MIKLKKKTPLIDQHDKFGFYGNKFGGNYCAETMRKPIEDLSKLFEKLRKDIQIIFQDRICLHSLPYSKLE